MQAFETRWRSVERGCLHGPDGQHSVEKHMKYLMTVAALVVVGTLGMPAVAALAGEMPSVTVQYSLADLEQPVRIARLHTRMALAAKSVCNRYEGDGLARQRVFQRCADRALATGVEQIQNAALSAYHLRKTGQPRNAVALASLAGVAR